MKGTPSGFNVRLPTLGLVTVGLSGETSVKKISAGGWRVLNWEAALERLGIEERPVEISVVFGGSYCHQCRLLIDRPRADQRFCSNGGRCRTAWHYANRKAAVEAVSALAERLESLAVEAQDLATEVCERFKIAEGT